MGGWEGDCVAALNCSVIILFIELPLRSAFLTDAVSEKRRCVSPVRKCFARSVIYIFSAFNHHGHFNYSRRKKYHLHWGTRAQIRGYKYTALNHFPVKNALLCFFCALAHVGRVKNV